MSHGRASSRTDTYGALEHLKPWGHLPLAILESAAWHALSSKGRLVLLALVVEWPTHENGKLELTFRKARARGIRRKANLFAGLDELQRCRLIKKTRQGGLKPLRPSTYALTWLPNSSAGHLEATHTWRTFQRGIAVRRRNGPHAGTVRDRQVEPIQALTVPAYGTNLGT